MCLNFVIICTFDGQYFDGYPYNRSMREDQF